MGQAKFSHDELLTALAEIEMVLNSRPLTYISADDLDEPLTPSHLLVGRRLMNFPDHLIVGQEVDSDEDSCQLNARLKHLSRSLDAFWRRWRREYLLELREAHRHHRSSGESQLSEGDIVVVYSDDQPRSLLEAWTNRANDSRSRWTEESSNYQNEQEGPHLYPRQTNSASLSTRSGSSAGDRV